VIAVVAALRSEAQPLVDHLGLERVGSRAKPALWARGDLLLAVSGVGRPGAERAVEALARAAPEGDEIAWLNFGLAGHRTHRLGRAFLASRVEDATTGEVWAPSPVLALDSPPAVVRTVDAPEAAYPDDVLYEMEAAAIFALVSRLAAAGPIQAVKIVSDNLRDPARTVTAEKASHLVAGAIPAIVGCIEELRRLQEGAGAGNVDSKRRPAEPGGC